MKIKIEEAFTVFERLLNEEKLYLCPAIDFARICSAIRVDKYKLDAYVQKEIGVSGQKLMDTYRASLWEDIKEKYGLEF